MLLVQAAPFCLQAVMAASNQGALSSGYKLEAFWLLYGKIWSFFHYNMHTHQIKYFFSHAYLIIMLNQQIFYITD